jgi:putative aldouronate transport system permease protein
MRLTRGETIFQFINAVFIIAFSLTILLPFIHLLSISFSPPGEAARWGLKLLPAHPTLSGYRKVFISESIWRGYMVTTLRTVVGTAFSLILTALGGYVLSKRYIPHRVFWTSIIVFTMFFDGGLIPKFLLVRSLGLIDSFWALILPNAIKAFHVLIMRNFFMTIPISLEESARIDGTSDLRILASIMMPLSKPVLATVGLWIAVFHWNSWFDCLVYIRDPLKFVLQIVLRRIVLTGADEASVTLIMDDTEISSTETVKAASIFVVTVPILCVYPFVQKYFVRGILVGSLKG